MTTADDPRVADAVVMWSGYGTKSWPARDERRVEAAFGGSAGELMRCVRALVDDFYASDARHVAVDLADMGRRAEADFRVRHPEVAEQVVEALSWCYTFDFR